MRAATSLTYIKSKLERPDKEEDVKALRVVLIARGMMIACGTCGKLALEDF